jgi:N-acetylneuraminic acid mutarotase
MRIRNLISFFLFAGLILACGIFDGSSISTVEVTRVVEMTSVVENTRIVKVTVVVTATPIPKLATQGVTLQPPRAYHTVTRLSNGEILLIGGSQSPDNFLSEVDIFDPSTGLSRQAAPLHTPRHGHTATLLADGRILVIGGYNIQQQWLTDAEIYDPSANTWTIMPPLHPHGVEHTATLMKDGRVLVVGGCIGSGVCTSRVEIFDPRSDTWSEAMPLKSNRASHTANLLKDGRILIAGGGSGIGDDNPVGGDALLYDPQTNSWVATGKMVKMRSQARSVQLTDGRVLIAGGITQEERPLLKMSASAEIYDPISNSWTAIEDLSEARYQHNLVLLADGRVLTIGGARDYNNVWTEGSFVREIECYNPHTGHWNTIGRIYPGAGAASVLLADSRVWVTGGERSTNYLPYSWMIDLRLPHP